MRQTFQIPVDGVGKTGGVKTHVMTGQNFADAAENPIAGCAGPTASSSLKLFLSMEGVRSGKQNKALGSEAKTSSLSFTE